MVENIFGIQKHWVLLDNNIMCIYVKGKWNLKINKDIYNNYELIITDIGERHLLEGKIKMNTIENYMVEFGENNDVYSHIRFEIIGNWKNRCFETKKLYNEEIEDNKSIKKINNIINKPINDI